MMHLNKTYIMQNKIMKKAGQIIIAIRDVLLIPEFEDFLEELWHSLSNVL